MKKFAVIGDPIEHSLSPTLHREIFRQLGIEADYQKRHVRTESLASFMENNGLDGLNVTLPHKETVVQHLSSLDNSADEIGAVNCVYRNVGYNTDWTGFLRTLEMHEIDLDGKACMILGAGGVARSVAQALIVAGVSSISVTNRSKNRADQLLSWIQEKMPANAPGDIADVIINCTPIGMWPDTQLLPAEKPIINGASILIDTIYNPLETEWLKLGRERGAKTVGGLDMFISQGLASADIWFQDCVSEKVDIEKIRQTMESALC